MKNIKTLFPDVTLSRRSLLKASVLTMASAGLPTPVALAQAIEKMPPPEKAAWSACTVNCGSRCPLRMHVRDGEIIYVETDSSGPDGIGQQQVRACLRGRMMRRRIYNPDRLKYPMKRIGKRGEGKFERIRWEEAYDLIAGNLKRLITQYGNESIYLNYCTGTLGGTVTKSWPPGSTLIARLMNCYGGYLNHYGDYSTAQIAYALNFTYGGWASGNSISNIAQSKLAVFFGNSPGDTRMSGGGETYCLAEVLQNAKTKLIIIDPRCPDTGLEHEWIPIRPGTDAALVAGMAHVLITENLVDQAFLDKYCVGYDEKTMPAGTPANGHYKAYVLGQGNDGIAKTPQWASGITGIPAQRIVALAREIGNTKPCYISQGWGPQRHSNGELTCRAITMLPILTGNVGISGGNSGAREASYSIPFASFPTLSNPIKTSISMFLWTDAVERGPEMTATRDGVRGKDKLDVPIKFIWNYAGNCIINQHAEVNRTHAILQDDSKCEMIVVIDNHMTPSARYADILLPDLTTSEQRDFSTNGNASTLGYAIFCDKAIEPRFESRSIYEMCTEIAKRLDVEEKFTEGRTQEEWLRFIYANAQKNNPNLPSYEVFNEMGIFKQTSPIGDVIAYKAFSDDPVKNKLSTPSGKIEIYSSQLAKIAATWTLNPGDVIDPLPVYNSGFEGWDDSRKNQFPLQMCDHHHKSRTHSTYGNVDILKEVARQELWINPLDAAPRNIRTGDLLRVYNDRGETRIAAKVTPRIMPGVVTMGQGSWYAPNADGVDLGGCSNVLNTQRPSPLAKGNPQHSCLVEVAKY